MSLGTEMERLKQELESIKAAISALESLQSDRRDVPRRRSSRTCVRAKKEPARRAEASER